MYRSRGVNPSRLPAAVLFLCAVLLALLWHVARRRAVPLLRCGTSSFSPQVTAESKVRCVALFAQFPLLPQFVIYTLILPSKPPLSPSLSNLSISKLSFSNLSFSKLSFYNLMFSKLSFFKLSVSNLSFSKLSLSNFKHTFSNLPLLRVSSPRIWPVGLHE